MKQLQDLLGEIHDCDELLPLVERHVEQAARARTRPRRQPAGRCRTGASTAASRRCGRTPWPSRERLYARFARKWAKLERDAFRARLELELARAGVPA